MKLQDSYNKEETIMVLSAAEQIANTGSWVWYTQKNQVIWSNQLYKILGIDSSEVASTELYFTAIHPDDVEAHIQASQKAIATNDATTVHESRVLWKDGTVRLIRVRGVAVLDTSGKIEKIVGSVSDITDEKKNEVERIQFEKLRSINTLAAGVAHDFNNYLQILSATVSNLALVQETRKDKTLDPQIKLIKDSANLCSNMIKKMIQLSSGQVIAAVKPVQIDQAIEEMSTLLKAIVGESIHLEIKVDVNLKIEIDEFDFNQIIVNLIKNSKLAITQSGKIQIRGKKINITNDNTVGLVAGDYACLEVIDSGCGIEKNNLSQVFDPFFSTRRHTGGSGLGLSGVYTIMQKYKGVITVNSEIGKGSTFKLYFKISAEEKNIPPLPSKASTKLNLKIIYIEDNNELREVFEESMTNYGFQVTSFASAIHALTHMNSISINDFDIIVSDVSMPQMTGIEFGIKMWNSFPQAKIVFLTGYSDPNIFKKLIGLESKFVLVSKPIQIEVLANAITKLINTDQNNDLSKKAG